MKKEDFQPLVRFDPRLWQRAVEDTEQERSYLQGFFYPDRHEDLSTVRAAVDGVEEDVQVLAKGSVGTHVVRDVALPPAEQELWSVAMDRRKLEESRDAAEAEYQRCHVAMMRRLAELGHERVAARYVALFREHYAEQIGAGLFG
ncbi:hypothetical protein ELZ19_06780 [Brucella abortus]|uniref:hypothetical protein n=1 Tax=Brucella abortus TaxID=235 RepID=UPI000F8EB0C9|nr:hypothetical protein [Brucella abortus]RUQ67354.1 hypothetical protein ELZ23_15615 [Brucella abortus]RUQ78339.1 hypothetical protein ELZ22_17165 [Brucella abortus]RUQ88259.1 hypothetical protein ELZ18_15465 [Brucella abortus]RUQ90288.1 hypothetical protein ELZ20_15460 [Brucella abortus]RUQ96526.1 hypothetical protein ELZ21_15565 [Brucella abortus]